MLALCVTFIHACLHVITKVTYCKQVQHLCKETTYHFTCTQIVAQLYSKATLLVFGVVLPCFATRQNMTACVYGSEVMSMKA